jgi:hypothetical protein
MMRALVPGEVALPPPLMYETASSLLKSARGYFGLVVQIDVCCKIQSAFLFLVNDVPQVIFL